MSYKIDKRNSPNKMSRNGWKPDIIVSHIMEGYYGTGIGWLCNPTSGASSHFVISKKGEIAQLVDIRESAWVNGTSTKTTSSNHFSKSNLKQVRDRKTNANYYTIGIEHEGFSGQGQGKLTPEQFNATVWLHKHIICEVKRIYGIDIPIDREHIVGHYQVDPIRKPNCPGKEFQWNELIKELKEGAVVNQPIIKPIVTPINQNIPSSWAKDAWTWGVDFGITDGSRPQNTATREEIVTMLYRLGKV